MSSVDRLIDRELRRWEFQRTRRDAMPPTEGMPGRREEPEPPAAHALITVSRQHGSEGTAIASVLSERLGFTLLDRDVIDRMCESAGASRRLLAALDEHTRSQLSIWVDSMVSGRYIDESDYLRALVRTIHAIGELGGVVVVGRGANFILGPDVGFHVRVVAPRALRIQNVMRQDGVPEREAREAVDRIDRERSRFVRAMFGRSIEDPLAYDVVVNTGEATPAAISDWLVVAAKAKLERMRAAAAPPDAPARGADPITSGPRG